jgi:hypothetical protein
MFTTFRDFSSQLQVADGNMVLSYGIGSVGSLTDVLFVPDLNFNLLSVSALNRQTGKSVLLTIDEAIIVQYDGDIRKSTASKIGKQSGGLWLVDDINLNVLRSKSQSV